MNKSDKITKRIKNLSGVNEDIGKSSVYGTHYHLFQLNSNGNGSGRTIATKNVADGGIYEDHSHTIFDFEMSKHSDGHTHILG